MTPTTVVDYQARTESPRLQLGESSDSQVSAKSRREPGAPGLLGHRPLLLSRTPAPAYL